MAKFIRVDKRKVQQGLQAHTKLLAKEPAVKKQMEDEEKELRRFIATEKQRRDAEHFLALKTPDRK